MSRTRRRDPVDTKPKRPDYVHAMFVAKDEPTAKERRKAHQDGKKSWKPSRAAKVALNKGAKARTRRALAAVVERPDEAPMPREPKDHVWRYN